MKRIAISEFKAKCLKLVAGVHKTKTPLTITKNGRPIANVVPFRADGTLESLRGKVKRYGDIVSPLGEAWEAGA